MPVPEPASTAAVPIRTQVREAVGRAWQRAVDEGALPALDAADAPAVEIERPAKPEHGDFATNLAMKLARPYRRPPLAIAEVIAAELRAAPDAESPIASVDVAPPGFVNLRLADRALEATRSEEHTPELQ